MAPKPSLLRAALAQTFRWIVGLYFRDIERLGEAPSELTGGRVVISNHNNALIDPALILTSTAAIIAPIAKSTLWDIPGLRWLLDGAGAVPIVRRRDAPDKDPAANAAMFARIADHLADGGNILIFPEGTSHSGPRLAPLRSGAARMLVAAEQRGGLPPTFQAVALEFDAHSMFRSRCLVLWGPVRRLGEVASDDADPEARVDAITAVMEQDLRELLVEGETPEERLRILRVARLLAADTGASSLGAWNNVGRQVELAHNTLRGLDPAAIAEVAAAVDAYFAELARLGLHDAQVTGEAAGVSRRVPNWRDLALAPLAATGVALYAIPYFIPRWVARSAPPDAVSTYKLGAAMLVYPVWASALVAGSFLLLPPPWSILAAAVAVTSPFAALGWLDRRSQRGEEARVEDLVRLTELRRAAREAIEAARAKIPA